jgi:2-dehydro-3-deoxygalactonokinase
MVSDPPHAILVDWGTSRFRAWLVDRAGQRLAAVQADDGIANVTDGVFGPVLMRHCGAWLAAAPALPVLMAGMIGSRNGWRDVPYAACPAGPADLAPRLGVVTRPDGGSACIVPGLMGVFDGVADVMRGEETLTFGLDVTDGLVVLPGTHSKWVKVEGGRIVRFATFMTGELYAAFRDHTILGRLAGEVVDTGGFGRGLAAARRPGGLTHQAFAARADVLAGRMTAPEVAPFLSGLLIAQEVDAGRALFGAGATHLVADGLVADAYLQALLPSAPRLCDPADALVAGLRRLSERLA